MTDRQKFLATTKLSQIVTSLTNENNTVRSRFGDRITAALKSECDKRDEDIAAYTAAVEFLNAA